MARQILFYTLLESWEKGSLRFLPLAVVHVDIAFYDALVCTPAGGIDHPISRCLFEECTGRFDTFEEAAGAARAITPPCSAREAIAAATVIDDDDDLREFLAAYLQRDWPTVAALMPTPDT